MNNDTKSKLNPDADENIYLVVPSESADRFESRLRELKLSAWRNRDGVTGSDVFIFTPEDDQQAIQTLKIEFNLK